MVKKSARKFRNLTFEKIMFFISTFQEQICWNALINFSTS